MRNSKTMKKYYLFFDLRDFDDFDFRDIDDDNEHSLFLSGINKKILFDKV